MFQSRCLVQRFALRTLSLSSKPVGNKAHSFPATKNYTCLCPHPQSHVLAPAAGTVCSRLMSASAKQFQVVNIQDEEDFKKRVLEATKPVVLDFHATWCGPCKLLGPRLESILSEKSGDVIMAKVDIDDNSDIAMNYGVRSVPTVMALKGGKVQDQFVGLQDDDKIRSFVDKLTI